MRRLKKAPSRATVSRLPEVQSGTSAYRSTRLDEPKTNVEKSTYLPTQILELASCQVSKKRLRGLPYPGSQRFNPVPQHTVRLVSMSQKRMSKKVHTSRLKFSSWQVAKFQMDHPWATVTRLPEVQSGTSAYRSTRLDEPKANVKKSTYLPTQILELARCED